jgi:hypothetical protein
MAEENNLSMAPRDFDRRPGGRDRGGYNEGAAWNRRPARRDMDIVDKELNRYQPAFDFVQRYPEGYGGQPTKRGGGGFGGGGRRGGGDRSGQIDRLIGAIEGMGRGGGGNVTNTFNPTFNPTNVNAGRDIRDTAILGGDNTAGRDIVGAGSGDVETGDGGGGNVVGGGGGNVDVGGGDTGNGDTGNGDTGNGDDTNKYDTFINKTYNDLLGRDADDTGKTYWKEDMDERGQTEDQVISNIKLGDEYKNREMAKDLAMSMEGKSYGKDDATYTSGYTDAGGDFESTLGEGMAAPAVMQDYYNPTTGKYTQATAGMGPKAGTDWVRNESPKFDAQGNTISDWTYGDPNNPKGTSKINEASLDAWIGQGGSLTQSSDEAGKGYYAGIDAAKAGEIAAPTAGSTTLTDRDQKIYDLYTDVFGRNPDAEGFQYWTSGDQDKMSLGDIEASFKGSAEQKLRDQVSGTNNFVSTDDYIAGKQNRGVGESGATNEDRSSANVSGTADNFLANTNNVTISPSTGTNTSNTGPNPTISTSQAAIQNYQNTKPAASSSTSTDADNFLNNLYSDLGINDGVVDQGGRDYWTEQLKNKSQAEVERDIKYAAAQNQKKK